MSAIVAVVNTAGVQSGAVETLLAPLSYRGTDGHDKVRLDQSGLGCHHLFTRSQDSVAPPPVEVEDNWIAFDGRIDNRGVLVRKLEKAGVENLTDAELLLASYNELGLDCLEIVEGPFALAIWDRTTRELVVARDKVGIRHVYYIDLGDLFLVASEPRAIAADPRVPVEPNVSLAREYVGQSITTPGQSFYSGIKRLEPGHVVVYGPTGTTKRRYWEPVVPEGRDRSFNSLTAELEGLLRESVRRCLPERAPAAISMSGGLDSTLVATLVNELHSGATEQTGRAFVMAFDSVDAVDERTYASAVSRENDVPLTVIDGSDMWALQRDFTDVLDCPCRDTSYEIVEEITHAAAESGFDRVFTGVGGNLFDGDRFLYPDLLRSGALGAFLRHAYADQMSLPLVCLAYGVFPLLWGKQDAVRTFRAIESGAEPTTNLADRSWTGPDQRYVDVDLCYDLSDPYMDFVCDGMRRIALRNGVELYHPLLSSRLVEFLFRMPVGGRFHRGRRKYLFRRVARDYLPEKVCEQSVHDNGYAFFLERGIARAESGVRSTLDGDSQVARWYSSIVSDSEPDEVGSERRWRAITTARWLQSLATSPCNSRSE